MFPYPTAGSVLFRGFHGRGLSWQHTRLASTAMTDSLAVAMVYANTPHPRGNDNRVAQVMACRLLKTPLILGRDEDVIEWGEVQQVLRLADHEIAAYLQQVDCSWRRDGEPLGDHPPSRPHDYTDTSALLDHPVTCARLVACGHDLVALRGTFTSLSTLGGLPPVIPRGSFRDDDLSVIEVRPLAAEAIEVIGCWPVYPDHAPAALLSLAPPDPLPEPAVCFEPGMAA